MDGSVIIGGVLKPDGTLELDEKPALPPGRVRVTLQTTPAGESARLSLLESIEAIRRDQLARGYTPRTVEQMEADEAAQRAEDEEYEERWRQIWSQSGPPPAAGEQR